jgi:hypothetical protein
VVLLPSVNHVASLSVHGPLERNQVELFWAAPGKEPEALSESELPTASPASQHLANSYDLFERTMKLQTGLVSSSSISDALNARVVLADGKLVEDKPQRDRATDVIWDFTRPGEPVKKRRHTDVLRFELKLRKDFRYWIVVSDGKKITAAYAVGTGSPIVDIQNGDGVTVELGPGTYILHSFAHLHDAVLVLKPEDHGEMEGYYPGDEGLPVIGAAEPICGGEQGDPEPPEDPPAPPKP